MVDTEAVFGFIIAVLADRDDRGRDPGRPIVRRLGRALDAKVAIKTNGGG